MYSDQHGHRVGRGTITVWKKILKDVIGAQYIYEFDYKKFHDRIDRVRLSKALINFGFPLEIARKLIHFCSTYVKGLDEKDPMRMQMTNPLWKYHHMWRGVVQGSNIAGLLGLIMLEDMGVYKLTKGKYLGYADDGLLYGDNEEVLYEWLSKLDPESGVAEKEEKSGWVKRKGKWISDLRFVGKAFNGETSVLRAATHSGTTTEMVFRGEFTSELEEILALRTKRNWTRQESNLRLGRTELRRVRSPLEEWVEILRTFDGTNLGWKNNGRERTTGLCVKRDSRVVSGDCNETLRFGGER